MIEVKKLRQHLDPSYNRECPSCEQMTRHTPEHWATYHPEAGTGHYDGCVPRIKPEVKKP